MNIITLDFETYYNSKTGYTLSKMSNLDYVTSPQFQAIGVAIAVNDAYPIWYSGDEVESALRSIDWGDALVPAHNAQFDLSILAFQYGIYPKAVACTMSMARAVGWHNVAKGASLAKLADAMRAAGYAIPAKGDEVIRADGKRLQDFSAYELDAYGRYCIDDTTICRALFGALAEQLPNTELKYQSLILKMYTEPGLLLDKQMLEEELVRVRAAKETLLDATMRTLGLHSRDELVTQLMSNQKFADLLIEHDVEPPMKDSKTAVDSEGVPKRTFAFAKNDEEFLALAEHDDEAVQALVSARLGTKSTIAETRLVKFIDLADKGPLSIPLLISGAHTHRLSGSDKINLQNMPSGRVKGQSNAMRRSLIAPPGFHVVAADSSQVELRVGSWVANDQPALELFRKGGDPYCNMAGHIFNLDPVELKARVKSKDEQAGLHRQIGKAAELSLGYASGAGGFQNYCKTIAKVPMDETLAKRIVAMWREMHAPYVTVWDNFYQALLLAVGGGHSWVGGPQGRSFYVDGARQVLGERVPGILMPDGMWISYYNLRAEKGRYGWELKFQRLRGRGMIDDRTYGGRTMENVTQGTAFAALKSQMVLVGRKAPVLLNVHDEAVTVAPIAKVPQASQYMLECFQHVPKWLHGCPLNGEVGSAERYGDC